MELRAYIDFLQRRWWLLVLGPLLAGLAAYFVSLQMTPQYEATSTLLVNRIAVPGTLAYDDILTSERLTNTYAQLVTRPAVLDEVIKRHGLNMERRKLESKITVTPIAATQLLNIAVQDPDPDFAATLANTTAQAFSDDNANQLNAPGSVGIAKPAEVPVKPVSPKIFFNVALAVVLGITVVIGLALLLDYLDDTVKTSQDIETTAGLPTLGTIGSFRPDSGPAFAGDQHSRSAEAYRQLRTNVHFTTMGTELKTIVITSSNPEEGKSTTAANLATVLAQAGDRVILVDTDLRRSSLRKTFDAPPSIGLTGLLLNDTKDPAPALVPTRWENLRLLPAGVLPPNPSELLTSARMLRVIQQLRQLADYVIFDTPPILAVTDAIVLAARTDGTILVTEAGSTRTEALREAAHSLKQANARVMGVVLNKAKVTLQGDYYYRDGEKLASSEPAATAKTSATALTQTVEAIPAHIAANPAATVASAALLDEKLAALRETHYPPAPRMVGALQSNSSNGQHAAAGHGYGAQHAPAGSMEPAQLSSAMTDLLSRLDDTRGLIRSLKPSAKGSGMSDS